MKKLLIVLSVMIGIISTYPLPMRGEEELRKKVVLNPPTGSVKRTPSNIAITLLFSDGNVTIIPNFGYSTLQVSIISEESGEEWTTLLTNGEGSIAFDGEAGSYTVTVEFPEGNILTGSFYL